MGRYTFEESQSGELLNSDDARSGAGTRYFRRANSVAKERTGMHISGALSVVRLNETGRVKYTSRRVSVSSPGFQVRKEE